ncbi:hypothetical protein ABIB62_004318 [Mucilaginibacter sp. UYP25]|uniref:hypothetical protein n=1 Tax=unclassified Mucilaginibacter TaxID=2617802 RepID=UPI0033939A49
MKLIYKLLLAALIFPALSYGQGNFKPGYVITLKGDTLKGLISEHEWDSNPKAVSFKPDTIHTTQRFTVADIKQFTIADALTYKRYVCSISLGTVDENHLNARDTTSKVDTVFLEQLQKGENISLYSYSDNTKTRFYTTEKDNDTPRELVYRLYMLSDPIVSKTENQYRQQLASLALKYGALTDKLQRTLDDLEFREHTLVKVAAQINGIDKPLLVKKKKNYTKLTLAVILFGVIAYLVLFKS